MSREALKELVGEWSGNNRLWLDPDAPAQESAATASVSLEADGKFATVRYTWFADKQPCEGMIVVRLATSATPIDLVWIDSWHMGHEFMTLRAEPHEDVIVSAKGTYPAPPGPDWGWRIALLTSDDGEFRIEMDNITPDGEEADAVELRFKRTS